MGDCFGRKKPSYKGRNMVIQLQDGAGVGGFLLQQQVWLDGWLVTLCPYQQYFSHIRTMKEWSWKSTLFMAEKNFALSGTEAKLLD